MQFRTEKISIESMLGANYASAVADAAAFYGIMTREEADNLVHSEVDMYPACAQENDVRLLALIGQKVTGGCVNANTGAPTNAFAKAFHGGAAPIGSFGSTRIGEDGRLYLIGKSEHYHASLGHSFEGYRLIEYAHRLGIPNATHNNTRGYITRLCERELIRACNGIDCDLDAVLASTEPHVLNRVINLETGSIAAEAGVKLMLQRFYKLDMTYSNPKYEGKTPVLLVMGDYSLTKEGNYHGTTMTTQFTRGLWPDLYARLESAGILKVVPVAINDIDDFAAKIKEYNTDKYKTAGFTHEIVMMNYGAVRLSEDYLRRAYELCRESDTPTMVDEIQTGMWYPGMLLHRVYGLKPDVVILGKGFPGGEYPASKMITTAEMDTLNQFGALVTNGQEELASLAYLITMRFAQLNGDIIGENGVYFNARLNSIAQANADKITKIEGDGLLAGITFATVETAAQFAHKLNDACIDTSAQLYKAHCPPAVLFKPPVNSSKALLDYICDKIAEAL